MSANSNSNMNMAMMSQNTKHFTSNSNSSSVQHKNALNFSQFVKRKTSEIIRFGFGVPCAKALLAGAAMREAITKPTKTATAMNLFIICYEHFELIAGVIDSI